MNHKTIEKANHDRGDVPEAYRHRAISWFRFLIFLIPITILLTPCRVKAHEFNPQGWPLPNIYGATRYSDSYIDFDPSIPGKETRLEKFNTIDGGRVYRYSHEGRIFSYEVDHDRNDPLDFEIVDRDGDGLFEIRQSPYNEYPLPFWTLD
jgi:hypothetical protein